MTNALIDTTQETELDIAHHNVSSRDLQVVAERLSADPFSGSQIFTKDQQNFRALIQNGLRYTYFLSQEGDQTVVTILSVTREDAEKDQRVNKLVTNLAKTVGAINRTFSD